MAAGLARSNDSTTIEPLIAMPNRPSPPMMALKPKGRLNSQTPKKAKPSDRKPDASTSSIMRNELNTSMMAPAMTMTSGMPTAARLPTASLEFSASPPITTSYPAGTWNPVSANRA